MPYRKTLYTQPDFVGGRWAQVSPQAKECVSRTELYQPIGMLSKDPKKRLTLKELLQHPWLVTEHSDLANLRKQATWANEFRMFSLVTPGSMRIYDEVKRRSDQVTGQEDSKRTPPP